MKTRKVPNAKKSAQRKARKEKKRRMRRKAALSVALTALGLVFCFAVYKIAVELINESKEREAFDRLSSIAARASLDSGDSMKAGGFEDKPSSGAEAASINETKVEVSATDALSGEDGLYTSGNATSSNVLTEADKLNLEYSSVPKFKASVSSEGSVYSEPPPPREILDSLKPLYEMNPDLFGWLKIDGTRIDYPVMHTPNDPEYYLHKAFDGTYSNSGVPFLDAKCDSDGNTLLVYGHHMKSGSMFAALLRYADESFQSEHPTIRLDTLYEKREYAVVAAFYSKAYTENDQSAFRYYEYTDLSDEDRFNSFVSRIKDEAIYLKDEIPFGSEILMLSTCSYHTSNGRFVVLALKV